MEVKAPQSSFLPQHCLRVPLRHTCPALFPRCSALVGPEGGAPGGTEKGLESWHLGWLQRFPGRRAGKAKGKDSGAVWPPSSPSRNTGGIPRHWQKRRRSVTGRAPGWQDGMPGCCLESLIICRPQFPPLRAAGGQGTLKLMLSEGMLGAGQHPHAVF